MGDTIYGHLTFLHDLQKCRLGFTRSTVDLICQQQIRHNHTRLIVKSTGRLVVHRESNDIRRHNIRRKLHTLILHAHNHRAGNRQCGFSDTRYIIQQNVSL